MSDKPTIQPLRIAPHELEVLLAELDRADAPSGPPSKRRLRRWKLRGVKMILSLAGPNGGFVHHMVVPRNLSIEGMAVLLSVFVHVGSACVLTVKDLAGRPRTLHAKVVRCRHLRGTLHDVGIRFDEPVVAGDFVEFGDEHAFSIERVEPEQLRGKVLAVEPDRAEQKLCAHHFKGSPLELLFAERGADALARLKELPDVVFVDAALPDMDGLEFIRRAIDAGCSAPLVLLVPEATPWLRKRALEAGAAEMLIKPCSAELMQQAVAEYLLLDGADRAGSGPIYSTVEPEHMSAELVVEYITGLQRIADQLTAALKAASDADAIAKLRAAVLNVKSSAPNYGFDPIERLAKEALRSIDATMSAAESVKELRALASACRRARPPRAACEADTRHAQQHDGVRAPAAGSA